MTRQSYIMVVVARAAWAKSDNRTQVTMKGPGVDKVHSVDDAASAAAVVLQEEEPEEQGMQILL